MASVALCGCAGFWDEVTSRDFKFRKLFVKPNPLTVLADSDDGDERAKALRALREPKQYGGTDKEQDEILKILTAAATTERQPLCRLAAIKALGGFKDPRAVQALKDAFYNAGTFPESSQASQGLAAAYSTISAIPPEVPTRIQCAALTALGETGNPAAVELLTLVVRQPRGEGAEQDRQQLMDVRIAAARALAKFNQQQATGALVYVLQNEQDVALRDRALESLQAATGRKLSGDPQELNALLQPAKEQETPQVLQAHAPQSPRPFEKLRQWFELF